MTETTPPADQAERRTRYATAIRDEVRLRLGTNALALAERGQPVQMNFSEAETAADAAIAVADAEQAELRTRISELESSCRDTDRLRKDWVEMRDRVEELDERAKALAAATVPASAPTDQAAIQAAALRKAAEDYATLTDQNEAYDRKEGDLDEAARLQYGTVRDIVIGLRRKANEIEAAASGPGRADGETQQDETNGATS